MEGGRAEEGYPSPLTARSDDVVILTTPRLAGRDGNTGRLASGSHVMLAGWQRLRHPPWLLVVTVVAAAAVVVGGVGAAAVAANSAKGSGGSELAARPPSQSEVPARFFARLLSPF